MDARGGSHRWERYGSVGFSPMPTMGYNFVVSLLDTSSGGALAKSIIFSAVGDLAIGGFPGVYQGSSSR